MRVDGPFLPEADTSVAVGPGDPAVGVLREAVGRSPVDARARYRLGLALQRSGDPPGALEQLERAVELDPAAAEREAWLLDLGIAYAAVSRFDEAARSYERLLSASPGHAKALHNLANLAMRRGEMDRAVELYGEAIAARPDYLLAHYHQAYALKYTGRYREAYGMYLKVLDLAPSNEREQVARTDTLFQLAWIDLARGEHGRAEQLLAQVVRIAPDHPAAHYVRGQALLELGREEDAEREIAEHMRLLSLRPPPGGAATAP